MIRSALRHLPGQAPVSTGLRTAGAASRVATTGDARPLSPGLRWISERISLDLPRQWMQLDIGPRAHEGLKKMGGRPLDDWYKNADTHARATRHMNLRLAPLTREGVKQAGLHPQELLALVLMSQQGLKAVGRTDQDAGTLSMATRLLSFLTVPAHLKRHMASVCQAIVNETAGPLQLFDASRDWVERRPEEREHLVRACFARCKALVPPASEPAGCLDDVLLDFTPSSGAGIQSMFNARLSVINGRNGRGETLARLSLSSELIGMDAAAYAHAYPLAQGDAGAALVPMLLAHELWHGVQHHLLDGLHLGLGARHKSEETLCMALSIGTQEEIRGADLATSTPSGERLLVGLPHEQQAWTMTYLMARALVQHPNVPPPVKVAARAYAEGTADTFSRVIGHRGPLRPAGTEGMFWEGRRLRLRPEPSADAATRVADVDQFMAARS